MTFMEDFPACLVDLPEGRSICTLYFYTCMYIYIYMYIIYIVQLTRRTYLCSRTLIVTPHNFLAWTNCGTFRGVWIFKYGQFHGCFRAILNFSAPTFLHSLVAGTSEIQTLASYAVPLSYWKNLTCKALRGS